MRQRPNSSVKNLTHIQWRAVGRRVWVPWRYGLRRRLKSLCSSWKEICTFPSNKCWIFNILLILGGVGCADLHRYFFYLKCICSLYLHSFNYSVISADCPTTEWRQCGLGWSKRWSFWSDGLSWSDATTRSKRSGNDDICDRLEWRKSIDSSPNDPSWR